MGENGDNMAVQPAIEIPDKEQPHVGWKPRLIIGQEKHVSETPIICDGAQSRELARTYSSLDARSRTIWLGGLAVEELHLLVCANPADQDVVRNVHAEAVGGFLSEPDSFEHLLRMCGDIATGASHTI